MIFAAWLAFVAAMAIGVSGWFVLLLVFTPLVCLIGAVFR